MDTVAEDRSDAGELTRNYPRLQSSFYRKLRKKYPGAFSQVAPPDEQCTDGNSGTNINSENVEDVCFKNENFNENTDSECASHFHNGVLKNRQDESCSSLQGKIVKSSKSALSLLDKDSLRKHELRNSDIYENPPRTLKKELKESKMAATPFISASSLDLRQRIAENNAQLLIYREKLDKTLKARGKLSSPEKIISADVHLKAKRNEKLSKNSYIRNHSFSDTDGHEMVSRRHVISPDSPPDSAIDMDSASLQSIMSGITDFGPSHDFVDYGPTHPAEMENCHHTEDHFDIGLIPNYKEPLLDSQSLERFAGKNGLHNQDTLYEFNFHSPKELLNGTHRMFENEPSREGDKSSVQGKRQHYLQRELEHEQLTRRLSSYSAIPTDLPPEDDELLLIAAPNQRASNGCHNDEVDDTDPRLGVQETVIYSDIDRQIAERYRQRKGRSKSTLRKRRSIADEAIDKNSELAKDLQNVTEKENVCVSCVQDSSENSFSRVALSNRSLLNSENAAWNFVESSSPETRNRAIGLSDSIGQGDTDESCANSHLSPCIDNCLEQETESLKAFSKLEKTMAAKTEQEVSDSAKVLPLAQDFQESSVENLPNKIKENVQANASLFNEVLKEMCSVASKRSWSVPDLSERSGSRLYLERSNRSMSDSVTVEKDFAEGNSENSNIHRARDDLTQIHFEEDISRKQKSKFSSKYSPVIKLKSDSIISVSELEPSDVNVLLPSLLTTETKNDEKPSAVVLRSVSDKHPSKPTQNILRNDSFAENNLTPYEISLYFEGDCPSDSENVEEIFSAKQIHIDKSDGELDDDRITKNSVRPSFKPAEIEDGAVTIKGHNSVESDLKAAQHPVRVHYRRKKPKDVQNIKPLINEGHYPPNDGNSQEISATNKGHSGNPCMVTSCSPIAHIEASRYQKSNLQSSKELSKSKMSLLSSAKAKIRSLRKAKSLDHLNQPCYYGDGTNKENYNGNSMPTSHRLPPPPPPPGQVKKTPSLRSLLNIVKKGKNKNNHKSSIKERPQSAHIQPPSLHKLRKTGSLYNLGVDVPTHPRAIGKLLELQPDGTQRVELIRPPHGPFGIYIARATEQYNYSVFVTRFSDGHPEKLFAGILNVGDEILEINGEEICNLSLDEVYDLMGSKDAMILRTIPIWNRKDTAF